MSKCLQFPTIPYFTISANNTYDWLLLYLASPCNKILSVRYRLFCHWNPVWFGQCTKRTSGSDNKRISFCWSVRQNIIQYAAHLSALFFSKAHSVLLSTRLQAQLSTVSKILIQMPCHSPLYSSSFLSNGHQSGLGIP